MKHLIRRLLIFSFIMSLLFLGGFIALLKVYGEPFLKSYIEEDIAEKLDLKITIAEMKIRFVPAISLRFDNIDIQSSDGLQQVQVSAADVFVDVMKMIPSLPDLDVNARVTLDKPLVTVKLPFLPPQQVTPPAGTVTPVGGINLELPGNIKLNLELDIQEGMAEVLKQNESKEFVNFLRIHKTFASLKLPSLDQEWDLSIISNVAASGISTSSVPLEIKAKLGMEPSPLVLKINSSTIRVGGIPGAVSGKFNPGAFTYSLNIGVNVDDLGKIRSFAFPGTWQGALLADIKVEKSQTLAATGNVQLKNVYGDLEYLHEGLKLSGSLGVNGSSKFKYDQQFVLESAAFAANLTNMALAYKEFFRKDRGIPLTALGNLVQDGKTIKINQLNWELGHVKGTFSGNLGVQNNADSLFKFSVRKTTLVGVEKFFPIIRSPLTGVAEVNVEMSGALSQPEKFFIEVSPLILSNVRIDTLWKSQDESKNVEGAITINTRSNFRIHNQELRATLTDTQIDFTRIGVIWGDTFIKPLGNPLRLDLVASQKDNVVQIQKADFTTPAGPITVVGEVKEPLKPDMKIQVQTPQLDLTRLSMMIPALRQWKLSGKVSGEIGFDGRYDPALGIEKTPLRMKGIVKAFLPEFAYTPAVPADGKPVADEPAQKGKVQSVLPTWPILTESTLRTELSLGKLFYKDLIIDGIAWKGNLQNGTLTGQVDFKQFFGGTVSVGKLRIPLKDAMPVTQLNAIGGNVDAGKAFDWYMPNWKGLFKGTANGSIDIVLLHPTHPEFLKETLVRGKLTMKDAFLSTVKFDQAVNEKLNPIPGLGTNVQLNTKGVAADIKVDFEYNKELLRFRSLDVLTPEKNQFKAVGWIRPDQTMDVGGEVFLVNPPVQGSVLAANSDKSGRMIVPVKFQGKVTQPQLDLSEQTIKVIMAKTAEYEGKRLRGEAQKALNIEVDKVKKRVTDEFGKGLKDLLGQ